MPRNATSTATPVKKLLARGRSQGHLSVDELRKALQEAGITPEQGLVVARELTDAGIRLTGADQAEARSTKKGTAAVKSGEPEPEPDLDDHSSVIGDSVHTYLKAIGRRRLLTAAEEVDLAK